MRGAQGHVWGWFGEPDPAHTYWPQLYLTGATKASRTFCMAKAQERILIKLFAGLSPPSLLDRTLLSLGGLWAL